MRREEGSGGERARVREQGETVQNTRAAPYPKSSREYMSPSAPLALRELRLQPIDGSVRWKPEGVIMEERH